MRNYSIVLSVIGLSFILFGAVMSFWISDPMLAKSIILLHGLLTTVAIILVAKTLPSEADKINCKNRQEEEFNSLWSRFDRTDDRISDDIDNVTRYLEKEIEMLHRRVDECENSRKK